MSAEPYVPRRRTRRRKNKGWIFFSMMLSLMVALGGVSLFLYLENRQNMNHVHPYPEPETLEEGIQYPLLYDGQLEESKILVREGEFLVPFSFLQRVVDQTLYFDEESSTVIVTTKDQVMTLSSNRLKNELQGEGVELRFPLTAVEGELYVPYAPLEKLYPYRFHLHADARVVELRKVDTPRLLGQVDPAQPKEEEWVTWVRQGASIKEPYVAEVEKGEQLELLGEVNHWYYVLTQNGLLGYVPKQDVMIQGIVQEEWSRPEKVFTPWKPTGGKINLTWEHVVNATPDPEQIPDMPGVNVVSPTWFHLEDNEGNLRNLAEKRYVNWAHDRGYQVWALVTNAFNPDLTHEVLSSYEKRRNVILQLLYFAELYDLDGVNIDFENVYLEDKENLVQFMRELTPYMHELGLIVSIDVTIKSSSEMWSMFLDRRALGEIVDYMMVMTYDEHWASSPVAGSVASLPWVEQGLQGVLEEVANEKLLLGVPFYTRIWKETTDEDGNVSVSSKAYSMGYIETWLEENSVEVILDESTGQNYGEYYDETENALYRVWIEDEHSMAQRMELVHKYNLAGVAFWRRGLEKTQIWDVIKDGLERRLQSPDS